MRNARKIHKVLVKDAKTVGGRCIVCLAFQVKTNRACISSFESFVIKDIKAFDIPTLDESNIQAQVNFARYDYTKNYFLVIGYQAQGDTVTFLENKVVPFDDPSCLLLAVEAFFKEMIKDFPNLKAEGQEG